MCAPSSVVGVPESKDIPPKLDSPCLSSSKHQITEEGNSHCARRISHVASTGMDQALQGGGVHHETLAIFALPEGVLSPPSA
jgi:hypothetical protein